MQRERSAVTFPGSRKSLLRNRGCLHERCVLCRVFTLPIAIEVIWNGKNDVKSKKVRARGGSRNISVRTEWKKEEDGARKYVFCSRLWSTWPVVLWEWKAEVNAFRPRPKDRQSQDSSGYSDTKSTQHPTLKASSTQEGETTDLGPLPLPFTTCFFSPSLPSSRG